MKVVIIGAGYTGLTAAYRLLQQGCSVTIFERSEFPGGLATTFKEKNWSAPLEKYYHHWFTNDKNALDLAKEIGCRVKTIKPLTEIYYQGRTYPFDEPTAILSFPGLNWLEKMRLGLAVVYLKLLPSPSTLQGKAALPWLRKTMGARVTSLVWEPLLTGKFGKESEKIALTWFWARIKKRTSKLCYPLGGFAAFTNLLVKKIKELGGEIVVNADVQKVAEGYVKVNNKKVKADKIIVTIPTAFWLKLAQKLPTSYLHKFKRPQMLGAQVLVIAMKKKFFPQAYWLNVTDSSFPFLMVVEHTNFLSSKEYGRDHLVYVGNYLPMDHPYMKLTAKQILKKFDPYLAQLNPTYRSSLRATWLFSAPNAQPVVDINYYRHIPTMDTPLKGVYLANMEMVYPWDRGTNYAIELGERVSRLITTS